MKLYTITAHAVVVDWAGTQAEAKAAKKGYEEEHGATAHWEEAEVPTDKHGLLAFLKKNCTTKPGE